MATKTNWLLALLWLPKQELIKLIWNGPSKSIIGRRPVQIEAPRKKENYFHAQLIKFMPPKRKKNRLPQKGTCHLNFFQGSRRTIFKWICQRANNKKFIFFKWLSWGVSWFTYAQLWAELVVRNWKYTYKLGQVKMLIGRPQANIANRLKFKYICWGLKCFINVSNCCVQLKTNNMPKICCQNSK